MCVLMFNLLTKDVFTSFLFQNTSKHTSEIILYEIRRHIYQHKNLIYFSYEIPSLLEKKKTRKRLFQTKASSVKTVLKFSHVNFFIRRKKR